MSYISGTWGARVQSAEWKRNITMAVVSHCYWYSPLTFHHLILKWYIEKLKPLLVTKAYTKVLTSLSLLVHNAHSFPCSTQRIKKKKKSLYRFLTMVFFYTYLNVKVKAKVFEAVTALMGFRININEYKLKIRIKYILRQIICASSNNWTWKHLPFALILSAVTCMQRSTKRPLLTREAFAFTPEQ